MRLDKCVGGGVRADERHVDGAGQDRCHGVAAGVEGVGFDGRRRTQRAIEVTVLDPKQCSRVGEVWEVAEADGEPRVLLGPGRDSASAYGDGKEGDSSSEAFHGGGPPSRPPPRSSVKANSIINLKRKTNEN